MRHLTAIVFDKRVGDSWSSSDYLPLVQRIMNAKVHDTIGVTPAELLFGQAINLYSQSFLSASYYQPFHPNPFSMVWTTQLLASLQIM
jgi:hypothetical protein